MKPNQALGAMVDPSTAHPLRAPFATGLWVVERYSPPLFATREFQNIIHEHSMTKDIRSHKYPQNSCETNTISQTWSTCILSTFFTLPATSSHPFTFQPPFFVCRLPSVALPWACFALDQRLELGWSLGWTVVFRHRAVSIPDSLSYDFRKASWS